MTTPVTAIDIADTENPLGGSAEKTESKPKGNRVAKGTGKATGTNPKPAAPKAAKPPKADKPKKEPKPKKEKGPAYPFESKRSILAKIESDDKYVAKSFKLLADRTAANEGGFMASHKTKAKEALENKDVATQRVILKSYVRKLAEIARDEAVAADPKLGELLKLFCSKK